MKCPRLLVLLVFLLPTLLPAQTGKRYWMSAASVRPDFWAMFQPGAQWDSTLALADVFSIHVNALRVQDTASMRPAIAKLNAAGVKVAFECGGLRPFSGCDSMAGEHHAQLELSGLQLWYTRGGPVDFITMDSPINTMIAGGDPSGTCGWSVFRAANEMVDYMKAVRAKIPNVTFGLVEPVPWYRVGSYPNHPGNNYGDLLKVLDTVFAVVAARGESLPIFHSDSPYEYSDNATTQGWLKLKAVEDYLHAHGLRHGRISNSQEGGATSNQLFEERTLASFTKYKAVGGDPDEIEIWCWYDHPDANTPESKPYTFTHAARAFFVLAGADSGAPPAPARLEPADGRVYHGVGQSGVGVNEYIAAMCDSARDSTIMPIVNKFYYSVPGSRGNKFTELRAMLAQEKAIGRIPELSIAFTDESKSTDSAIAAGSRYDGLIDSLADVVKEFGRGIFIRPGFEFNGSWNKYHPYFLPQAFRKVVDRFRMRGAADSAAFVWCYYAGGNAPNDFDSVDGRGARWYPGASYVDWFGLDLFAPADFDSAAPLIDRGQLTSRGKGERFLGMARAAAKPVYLSETSAQGVNTTGDPTDGFQDWHKWFVPFFAFIERHPEVKGFNYINWDWTQYPTWASWGDARIQNSPYILEQYRAEMKRPKYIHLPHGTAPPAAPDKVMLKAPATGMSVAGDTAHLVWYTAQKGVTFYHLQVGAGRNFQQILLDDSTHLDTAGLFAPLMPGVGYQWHVRARNGVGWGPWSDVFTFTRTPRASVEGQAGSSAALAVIPNPSNGGATVDVVLGAPGAVTLTLYDLSGAERACLYDGVAGAGAMSMALPQLASGSYLLRLRTASGVTCRRVEVVR